MLAAVLRRKTGQNVTEFLKPRLLEPLGITTLQEFFMDISIVKDFTVSLAAMITGNKHVEHMLAQGMETGNFFVKMGEKDGVWRCKDAMRWSVAAPSEKKQGRDTLDRSTLSQTGAGRRKKDGADVPWISQDKSGGRSHTFRYRTEDSADAGRGRFHEQDSRTAGAGGSDGEVSLSGNLP